MANFDQFELPELAGLRFACGEAERALAVSAPLCAMSVRRAMEQAIRFVFLVERFPMQEAADLYALLTDRLFRAWLPEGMFERLEYIRRLGNLAAHTDEKVQREDCVLALFNLYEFVRLITYAYGGQDAPPFDAGALPDSALEPQPNAPAAEALAEQARAGIASGKNGGKEKDKRVRRFEPRPMDEVETRRRYVDMDLREAGWRAGIDLSSDVPLVIGGVPDVADYVLRGAAGETLGVIEVCEGGCSAQDGRQRAKLCADALTGVGTRPVIFYTNGFEIWMWDDEVSPPRQVSGFFSPDDLAWRLRRRAADRQAIAPESVDGIGSWYFQRELILSVLDEVNRGRRRALLSMAAGTGKTRTALSLIDCLFRVGRARRALYLAGSESHLRQTHEWVGQLLPACAVVSPESGEMDRAENTVCLSSYGAMARAIDARRQDKSSRVFTSGFFDVVVLDEVGSLEFGTFGALVGYFDAFLVGLTSIPSGEIPPEVRGAFELSAGDAVPEYPMERAIRDGFLVPYQSVLTKLSYRPVNNRVDLDEMVSWLWSDQVIDRALELLMARGEKVGETLGKTILFAQDIAHARKINERFDRLFPGQRGEFARLVDGDDRFSRALIDSFVRPDAQPTVAISADALAAGVDAPAVVNLMFLCVVPEKTEFWRRIGRGMRRCAGLYPGGADKERVLVFDFLRHFELFKMEAELDVPDAWELARELFCRRVELVYELQSLERQDAALARLRTAMLEKVARQIASIDRSSFAARENRRALEGYLSLDANATLTEQDVHRLRAQVAPALPADPGDVAARRFDALMLDLLLKRIRQQNTREEEMEVISSLDALSRLGTIRQIASKRGIIDRARQKVWWKRATPVEIENLRAQLRGLAHYLEEAGETAERGGAE